MINKAHITAFQLFFVLLHVQVGVGIISLPYSVFNKANVNSWISILLTGIIIQVFILLFGKLMVRFPSQHLFEIIHTLFGKVVGKILTILYTLVYIFIGIIGLAKFVYILKIWMMPHTPRWVLLGLMCFTVFFIVKNNLQIIARFMFISSFIFIGFIIVAIYSLKYAHITFILPVAADGMMPIFKGTAPSLFAFQGFEMLLIMYPFVQAPHKEVLKTATMANIFITLFYTMLTFASILFFSAEELKLIPQPVLYIIKAFSTRIIERPDLIFTALWIIIVATSLMGTIYTSSIALTAIKKPKSLILYTFIIASLIFLGSLALTNKYVVQSLSNMQDYILIPFIWGMPIILLLISILFNKKEKVNNE